VATIIDDRLLQVHRHPERGSRDRGLIEEILDSGVLCHLGVVHDDRPVVIPTLYARDGDRIILHGSAAARSLRAASDGLPVCVTVTLLDGLVLAPTAFNHSANYRSVVVHGTATLVTDEAEKLRAVEVLTEHLTPGRWAQLPQTTTKELRATAVLTLPLDHAVAKVRAGGVGGDPAPEQPAWIGVVPIETTLGDPEPHPGLITDGAPPAWAGGRGVPHAVDHVAANGAPPADVPG
jgi:uncharacterized protein